MDERGNLNRAQNIEGESTRKRVIRPLRLPSILKEKSPRDDKFTLGSPELIEAAEELLKSDKSTGRSTERVEELPNASDDPTISSVVPTGPLGVREQSARAVMIRPSKPLSVGDERIRGTTRPKSLDVRDEPVRVAVRPAEPFLDESDDYLADAVPAAPLASDALEVGITPSEPFDVDEGSDTDRAEQAEPTLPMLVRRPREFRISRKHVPEKDSAREGRSVKKSLIPLRYKSLEEAMGGLRDFHPLPFELILTQTPHYSTWIMTQIKGAKTKKELKELAFSLSYKDLSLLFTTLSTKKKRDEIDQIVNLIRLRASHYLYLCGWLTLQYCYPRSSVSRALSDLCTILEDLTYVRDNRLHSQRISREPLALPVVSLGRGRVIWTRVPLISRISSPNSRHFIADIVTEMIESKVDPEAFFTEYAIIPGQPLANAIEVRYNEMVTGVAANPLLSSDFFDRFRR